MARKSIIIVIIGALIILISKDYLLKFALTRYIRYKLGRECIIGQAKVFWAGISVENLRIFDKDVDLKLKKGAVLFRFQGFSAPEVSQIIARQLSLKVDNFTKVKDALNKRLIAASGNKYTKRSFRKVPLLVNLDNATLQLQDGEKVKLYVSFSLRGFIENNNIEKIEYLVIHQLDARFKNLAVSNVTLTPEKRDNYVLTIPQVKIRNKEIEGFRLPLRITRQRIKLIKEQQDFFGPAAYFAGSIAVKNFRDICLSLELSRASFAKAVNLLTDKESISFEGLFDGKIDMCLKGAKFLRLAGNLTNDKGGIINIEKDVPGDFLKKRLSQTSYKALIDNFRNYQYNKGRLEISKSRGMITLKMEFYSPEGGRRNLIMNFHNIPGGE